MLALLQVSSTVIMGECSFDEFVCKFLLVEGGPPRDDPGFTDIKQEKNKVNHCHKNKKERRSNLQFSSLLKPCRSI